jgi:hypothetical protein
MSLITILPLLARAAFMAWRHASRFDELSMNHVGPREPADKSMGNARTDDTGLHTAYSARLIPAGRNML